MIERLRKIFEESGLTQKDFAISIGLTPNALTELFSGRAKSPSVGTLENLIKTYDVNPLWFITGEGPERKPRRSLVPLSEEKIREMDAHDRRVRKMTTTPGAVEMIDNYLALNERDRSTVNSLVKQLKG
ncbi:helix-turn-helix transcriptional regulator (plasmid) [Leptospira interrogans]|uniref:helix-turn-helix domain-containing protein n=1 Tax=Leptospira interrogans TaxID=173 RepID=UPI0002BDD9DC|nr:helix-turn-helix transcriptional regulator [Leptospira interrogans]EMN60335.1 DNA-binding helix-turn-helix protein [Leptospira interrogans serovar Pyrogenes str. R168]ULG90678.1 helix-turn-helix transcriptional regulator [Leptospira interrogans]ULG90707.1 helix-turn-helix transcriptional regulator [Leptospira interrogans]UML78393.1 helix-turn-helix transcriptional regulator [Leptospira interrogans]UML78449.1 helix-turn-helix transcriptional regulator [Leptospira interrogans]